MGLSISGVRSKKLKHGQICIGRVHHSFVLQGPDWDNTVSLFPEAAHLPTFSAWSTILIENNNHFYFLEAFPPPKSRSFFSHDWRLYWELPDFIQGPWAPYHITPHFLSVRLAPMSSLSVFHPTRTDEKNN